MQLFVSILWKMEEISKFQDLVEKVWTLANHFHEKWRQLGVSISYHGTVKKGTLFSDNISIDWLRSPWKRTVPWKNGHGTKYRTFTVHLNPIFKKKIYLPHAAIQAWNEVHDFPLFWQPRKANFQLEKWCDSDNPGAIFNIHGSFERYFGTEWPCNWNFSL